MQTCKPVWSDIHIGIIIVIDFCYNAMFFAFFLWLIMTYKHPIMYILGHVLKHLRILFYFVLPLSNPFSSSLCEYQAVPISPRSFGGGRKGGRAEKERH